MQQKMILFIEKRYKNLCNLGKDALAILEEVSVTKELSDSVDLIRYSHNTDCTQPFHSKADYQKQ